MVERALLGTVFGTILGSIVEEGLEEIFPGLGELGAGGEIGGAIAGLIVGTLAEEEGRNAINKFLRYAFFRVNGQKLTEGATEDELINFQKNFEKMPPGIRKEIISSYKNADPHGFQYLNKVFSGA